MTVEEIYSELTSHMLNGIMFHEQLADYYIFLGLTNYSRCHEKHFISETNSYRSICRYYCEQYDRLISDIKIDNPRLIPSSWYKHSRLDVDANTRLNACRNGAKAWVDWEMDTKKFYEQVYSDLINLGEIASALKVAELLSDVDEELVYAKREYLKLDAVNYDMSVIVQDNTCNLSTDKE